MLTPGSGVPGVNSTSKCSVRQPAGAAGVASWAAARRWRPTVASRAAASPPPPRRPTAARRDTVCLTDVASGSKRYRSMSGSSSRRNPDETLHPLRTRSRQFVLPTHLRPPGRGPGRPCGPFCASIPAEGEGSFVGMADDPVATAASNNPYLTTLSAAVQAAGLVDDVEWRRSVHIFAPSNEAFADVPPSDLDEILADTDLLTSILTYHVVAGESLSAADLAEEGRVTSVQGGELRFTTDEDGALSINGGAAMATAGTSRPPTRPCT